MTTATFDAVTYKASTREQWQFAAAAWNRLGPHLEEWLGRATQVMLTERLAGFQGSGGFVGPCELIVVVGTAPQENGR